MSRITKEILSFMDTNPKRETLEAYIDASIQYHDEIKGIEYNTELHTLTKKVAFDVANCSPNFVGEMGIWGAFKLWLELLIFPQKTVSRISALSLLILPKFIERYRQEILTELEDKV